MCCDWLCVCVPGQVLVLVEVLKVGGLTDELGLLAHLLAGAARLRQLHLQSAERRPHHLAVTEVLHDTNGTRYYIVAKIANSTNSKPQGHITHTCTHKYSIIHVPEWHYYMTKD